MFLTSKALVKPVFLVLCLLFSLAANSEESAEQSAEDSARDSAEKSLKTKVKEHPNQSVALPKKTSYSFNASQVDSISHFRAFPLSLSSGSSQGYVRQSIQDAEGYLWLSGIRGVRRYDGYTMKTLSIWAAYRQSIGRSPFLFVDRDKALWLGDAGLLKFIPEKEEFREFAISQDKRINHIAQDLQGYLWVASEGLGLLKFDTNTEKVILEVNTDTHENAPMFISSMAIDHDKQEVWLVGSEGFFVYSMQAQTVKEIKTPVTDSMSIFAIRNILVDKFLNELWVGTPEGLVRINTFSHDTKIYKSSDMSPSLSTSNVSTVFQDSSNNLWIGLEKAGLCLYQRARDSFICLPSSTQGDNALPAATVEDISEDSNGSLWLSMNNYGMYRITPFLEKFRAMQDYLTHPIYDYFPHSMRGIVLDSGDVWIGTDGGGINIFNHKKGTLKTIKHDPDDVNSIPSNSVISLSLDENGYVWGGTYAGGVFRADPNTLEITRLQYNPTQNDNQSLAGNNVFAVLADGKQGLWISVWGEGIQYYDIEQGLFTNYLHKLGPNGKSEIGNNYISHLELFENRLFMAGDHSLEYLDLTTGEFFKVFRDERNQINHMLIESMSSIWAATNDGLFHVNYQTGEHKHYTVESGLNSQSVNYLALDQQHRLWVATNKGVSVLDLKTETFRNYYQRDGLITDTTSIHGEFFTVEDTFYIPTKKGVSVIAPSELPINDFVPKTVINAAQILQKGQEETPDINPFINKYDEQPISLPYESNSLEFQFKALSFIFPEENQFRYRLVGWQDTYTNTNASDRTARFTNLSPGNYTFEVFSANSSGVWDEQGASFSFTILPPWWQTWWSILLFILSASLITFFLLKWRIAIISLRENELRAKVKEKTFELATLNAELEGRVQKRTFELEAEINERKTAESRLFHMAFHDTLTELANREKVIQLLEDYLKQAAKDPQFTFGIMFLDGDRFKQVNDTYGHIFGDQLLVESAKRLILLMQGKHDAGRLGGDEFTVLAKSMSIEELEALAAEIVDAFKVPFIINNCAVNFNVSIGVVRCGAEYRSVPEVLRHADIAMYHAKESGKGTYRVFDSEMQNKTAESLEIEMGLREALEKNQFELLYQPIVSLDECRINGFEALIRWNHPEKGVIEPLTFIPIAEETGLIWDIGTWVLNEACRQTKYWHDQNFDCKPNISVNLSANQLRKNQFLDILDEAISAAGIESKYLKLELTESILIENNEELESLYSNLEKRNIDLAIDDFGTGYSSLAYLKDIPVTYLKIDKKFLDDIQLTGSDDADADALKILDATIYLSYSLERTVIAEGIETEVQLKKMIELGCNLVQGYYLSKPVSSDAATDLLKSELYRHEGGVKICKIHYKAEYDIRNQLLKSGR